MKFAGSWFVLLGLSAIAARYFGVAATDVVAGLLVVVAACLIGIEEMIGNEIQQQREARELKEAEAEDNDPLP